MADAKFNASVFSRHLENIHSKWKANPEDWGNVAALVIVAGKETGGGAFPTATTLFSYLFQFELPDTIFVLTRNEAWVATGPKKVRMMEEMMADPAYAVPVTTKVHALNAKDATSAAAPYAALWEAIIAQEGGKSASDIKIGIISSDLERAPASFKAAFAESQLVAHDVAGPFSNLLVHKDDVELKCLITSSSITKTVLKKIAVPQIESTIDEGTHVQHRAIANELSEIYQTPGKISEKLADSTHVDCGIVPVVQSGGVYSLTEPLNTEEDLHFGCIVIELGSRFKSYCSIVGRTYLVDAPDAVRKTYNFTVELQSRLIALCVPGTVMSSIYKTAVAQIESTRPDLLPHFVINCGTSIGLECYESPFVFDDKCEHTLSKDMVVTVRVGFGNVELAGKNGNTDPKWAKYTTLLTDTVQVGEAPQVLTDTPKKYKDVSYSIQEEEEDGAEEAEKVEVDQPQARTTRQKSGAADADRIKKELQHQKHQLELAERQKAAALIRFPTNGPHASTKQVTISRDFLAYPSLRDFPQTAPRNRIFVDQTNECLLLPVYGQSVPFHILTVKTVTKHDGFLKITFRHPEANQTQVAFKDPNATFVKEVMFRIAQPERLANYHKDITALKKKVTDRETKKAIEESLVAQDPLRPANGGPKLSHLSVRPALGGRKTVGVLECHPNGFRFTTTKKGIIDITFKNIKHAFFQPAENDAIILIHFNLHQPLVVGKKKTHDVQFYTEAAESTQVSANKTTWGDADEIEAEQMERQMLNKLNKQFNTFCDASTAHSRNLVQFDSPYRSIGFDGIFASRNVVFYPTTNCLVSLIEANPFFIVTLEEVEIVFFERVQFALRLFDMTFVFKDYSKPTMHIGAIPRDNFESIKDWLDSCDVKHYSGMHNVNWKALMKEVQEDPRGFWEDGGWATLEEPDSEDEEEKGEDEEAPEEDFQPESSDSEDYRYADDSEDESYGGEDEEDYDDEEDPEDDWDAQERRVLEEEARKSAKRKGHDDDDDDGAYAKPAKKKVKRAD